MVRPEQRKGANGRGTPKQFVKYQTSEENKERLRTLARDWNHPRRCQQIIGYSKQRCKRWALKGKKYCFKCGQRSKPQIAEAARYVTRNKMTIRFYRKFLGPSLREAMEEMLCAREDEQMSLLEELALMRNMAGEAIGLYQGALSIGLLPNGQPDPTKEQARRLAITNAVSLMSASLEQVRVMAKTASDISAQGKDKYSIATLEVIVEQIVKMVDQCFGDNDEGIKAFNLLIRENLKIPKRGVDGTELTPDQDVLDMDATIPRAE